MTEEIFLTVDEVATRLKVTKVSVYRWLSDGSLKGVKLNRNIWRVRESDLQAFIHEPGEGVTDGTANKVNS